MKVNLDTDTEALKLACDENRIGGFKCNSCLTFLKIEKLRYYKNTYFILQCKRCTCFYSKKDYSVKFKLKQKVFHE